MIRLISSEMLFYSGIVMMAAAVFLSVICILLFYIRGKRLKDRLLEEYGKPYK